MYVPLPQAAEQIVNRAERCPMVAAGLERRGDQQQPRALGDDGAADPLDQALQVLIEAAVRQVEVVGAGDAEDFGRLLGFLPAPTAIGLAVFALRAVGAAVGEEEHADGGAGGGKLGHQPAAAEHLVVVVRGEHQGASGSHFFRRSRRGQW